MILKHLRGLEDPPLACNRLLRPFLWRRALLTQDIFPWLWDIKRPVQAGHNLGKEESQDPNHEVEGLEIFEYTTYELPDEKWDWELLVRQWAQKDIFEPGNYRQDVHLALRNRRRIWRILEEMRVGDVPEITEWPSPESSDESS